MYNSQYYTCEQIDERLLQGYLDDYNTQTGQSLTKAQFLTKLGSIFSKEGVIDNTATQIGYYECDTAAGTAAKTITVANYALFAGGSMKVKFVNKNTANNATLNINSQGAKALYYQGERASATNSWDAEEVVEIYYDGTSYYANNVKGGSGSGVYDVSKEHPTSGPNSDGKFTLEYILNPSNVNELIPVNKRYPGMSIQFVSTSDNKYIRYNLIADEFTTDTTHWAIADEGVYVENPEFVYVKTDSEGKILWAVKADGSIYYGAGVPQQVIDYIEQNIGISEYEDIVTFLNNLEKEDKTLTELLNGKVDKEELNGKVDKEEGKELIPSQFIEQTNTPYLYALIDSDGKILCTFDKESGKPNFPTNTLYDIESNPEFSMIKLDEFGKFIYGLRKDGSWFFPSLKIEDLRTHWFGKSWHAYGTSLTNINREGKYAKYVSKLSGLVLHNHGISGGSIMRDGESIKGAVFNDTDGKTTADLVTLECWANDGSAVFGEITDTGNTTFLGNLAQCIMHLQEVTHATIVIMISTMPVYDLRNPSSRYLPTRVYKGGLSCEMADKMRQLCDLYGVYFINPNRALGNYRGGDKYIKDNIHHTELGGLVYARYIWSQLKNLPQFDTEVNI